MNRTSPIPSKLALLGVAGALLTTAAVAAPSAQAAARDGVCEPGEFCLYFNSDHQGSVSDFTSSIPDYGAKQPECYEYRGPGAGKGRCVKNEAAAAWNRTGVPVTVFFNSGYAGASQTIAAGGKVNLDPALKNENASHRFGTGGGGGGNGGGGDGGGGNGAPATTAMSFGLYHLPGGRITCGFDGYDNTPGRHEGIDIARGIGSPVRALVSGTVTNVSAGARGGSGLSTIAVYNARYDKTIVYLHSAPGRRLHTGQRIKRGQRIATEDWRGISSPGAAHTHVEMRLGRTTLAAKSVGDPRLDNPNPTAFWQARGFQIR
jgi:murein DD-endopeptidase MepM/ murein hydrolase activator NlpD